MSTQKFRHLRIVGAAGTALVLALTVAGCSTKTSSSGDKADTWKPSGQVHMVVPFSPGGGSDIFGRAVASGIQDNSSAKVTTENHEGGSGAVGYSFIRSKKGNGQYLLAAETSLIALPMTTKLGYTWKSFTPLMQLANDNNLLMVPADSKLKNLKDVVALAKKGKFRMGVSGTSSPDALVANLFQDESKVKFRKVVVQSGGEMVTQLLGGSLDGGILNPGEAGEQIKAGKLRAIGVFSDERLKGSLSDIPTAKEQGIDVSFGQWRGIFGPPDMTDAQIKYWTGVLKKYSESADYKKYVKQNDLVSDVKEPAAFKKYLSSYADQVKQALPSGS
ncbi:Bug family tripartite tricarboxylate transporter substrate binding protein [Spelaeicoccus albus]|uniref:Putative tricarboxylic transport membrane protein n=1 Tax=Spelaeicoccus albus TaxID=1280376 RepID=A0A7Z0D1J7_9MICO|nr:tripartite tricarboxylate transporter substrate binding protein [Spelaeicoccus albus]NYI67148.1 putative tricarboxylic transport membrane protein [Spelaeicoccus albus]